MSIASPSNSKVIWPTGGEDGASDTVAALFGPLVLAAIMGDGPSAGPTKIITGRPTAPEGVGAPAALPTVQDGFKGHWLRPLNGSTAQLPSAANGATVMPLYQVRDQKYSVYWQRT